MCFFTCSSVCFYSLSLPECAPRFVTACSSQQSWLLGLKIPLGLKTIHLPVLEKQEEGTCCNLEFQHPAHPWHHIVYSPLGTDRLQTVSVCFIPFSPALRPHRWQAWMKDPYAYCQPCSRQFFPGKLKNTFHPAQIIDISTTESGYSINSR